MKTKSLGKNVCKQLGMQYSAEQCATLEQSLATERTCILCADGEVLADTNKNRAEQYNKGAHIITNKGEVRKVPFTVYTVKRRSVEKCVETSTCESVIEVRKEKLESGRKMFAVSKGERTRKHGQRGGMGDARISKFYSAQPIDCSRPWRRGEKVRVRNANKRALERERIEYNACSIIKASRYGVLYKSEPKATKRNCGRNID